MGSRRPRFVLLAIGLLVGPALASRARAEASPSPAPASAVAGAFCAPRTGSPVSAAVGFGVAALGIALLARRRGASAPGAD